MLWKALLVAASATVVSAQTWCGKNYMASQPIVPPGGQFPVPAISQTPLLAFRCAPAIRPYLPEDASSPASFIVDTTITHSNVAGAKPISLSAHGFAAENAKVQVTVSVNGRRLAGGSVPLNATKHELSFSLAGLKPQETPFDVQCTAELASGGSKAQKFEASTTLAFLPDPPQGRSVTKMDLRTGALLARPATGGKGPFETVLPIGFYTGFGNYLASNLSIINELKDQGFTVVHPIPTFDNLTALDLVLDRMQEVGLYLMYDMRWTYMNSTAVTEEVNRIKNRPNLLLWYTADEPDGTSDPSNATTDSYDLIYSLDGYHPVSLVLNCENFFFTEYTAGTDIVMQDTYMVGNNVTFSVTWHTPCTEDYGDCGCDNCHGAFTDISHRMDAFAERLTALGWDRTKAVWTVPQAFGGDGEYWARAPTGKEYVVQSAVALNHGARGVVAWDDPTPADIKASASALSVALGSMKAFILSPQARFVGVVEDGVDVGMWTVGKETLVLATNMEYVEKKLRLRALGLHGGSVRRVLDSGASEVGGEIVFESVGTGAFVVS